MNSARWLKIAKIIVPIFILGIIIFGGYCFANAMIKTFSVVFIICILATLLWVEIVKMDIQRGG